MYSSFVRFRIIGAAALVLAVAGAGCSMLRASYNQGPTLAYWWVDDYVDFNDAQAPQAKRAIAEWFAWHRSTQLGDYVGLLERAQAQAMQPATAAAACEWEQALQQRAERAYEQALPGLARVALQLTPEQIKRLEKQLDKKNKSFREEHLPDDPEDRREATLKRSVKRAEMLYGRLDRGQRDRMAQSLAQSPFDGELWYAERIARQQDLLRLLRTQDPAALQDGLREWGRHFWASPRPVYRAYQQRMKEHSCAYAAFVHNLTTPAQRETARHRLQGWEDDLRQLSAQPSEADVKAPAERARGAG